MTVRFLPALFLLLALAACEQRQPTTAPSAARVEPARYDAAAAALGPRCAAGERPVYACAFKSGAVSVCATDRRVTYRHGAFGKTDLTITSTGADGHAHLDTQRGPGQGGQQTSLRFSNAGYDYIVYAATGGADTAVPGRHWSGLVVMKAGQEVSSVECPSSGPAQRFTLDTAPAFVAREDDPAYQAFF